MNLTHIKLRKTSGRKEYNISKYVQVWEQIKAFDSESYYASEILEYYDGFKEVEYQLANNDIVFVEVETGDELCILHTFINARIMVYKTGASFYNKVGGTDPNSRLNDGHPLFDYAKKATPILVPTHPIFYYGEWNTNVLDSIVRLDEFEDITGVKLESQCFGVLKNV